MSSHNPKENTSENHEKEAKKRRSERSIGDRIFCFIIWGFIVVAATLVLYTPFFDALAGIDQTSRIGSYEDDISSKSRDELDAEKARAVEYNADIAARQKKRPLVYQGSEVSDDAYESLLSEGKDKIMGYVDIPKIHVSLPIAHGTRNDILEYEVGHMYGSSLPIGGESTHAVITGHTGLKTAMLFTDLTEVDEGDYFYINIVGEKHVYQVDMINVVLPEDDYRFLQVEDGQDYVTLYTCTPYGINDHRLLVRGRRVYPDLDVPVQETDGPITVKSRDIKAIAKVVGIGLVPILLLIIGLWRTLRSGKKRKGECGSKKPSAEANQ